MEESDVERILSSDFSASAEDFREALLTRCLDIVRTEGDSRPLDDEALELLAAAGDPSATLDKQGRFVR